MTERFESAASIAAQDAAIARLRWPYIWRRSPENSWFTHGGKPTVDGPSLAAVVKVRTKPLRSYDQHGGVYCQRTKWDQGLALRSWRFVFIVACPDETWYVAPTDWLEHDGIEAGKRHGRDDSNSNGDSVMLKSTRFRRVTVGPPGFAQPELL